MLDVVTGSAPLAPFDGFVPLIGWQLRTPALQQSKAAATTTTTTYIIEGAEYAGGAFIDACVRWGIVPSARSSAGVALQVAIAIFDLRTIIFTLQRENCRYPIAPA